MRLVNHLVFLFLFFSLSFISPSSHASGGITHMMIAKDSIDLIHDMKLRHLILNNMDAYLVGSNYPDSGFVTNTHYGENSHWEPFINAYLTYLFKKYRYPEKENPKLVAFLLGISTHVKSDIIFHWTFLDKVAENDFHGDKQAAHQPAERGLDILVLIDKNQWKVRPTAWWVPYDDLINIYKLMGLNVPKDEIMWGNSVYSLAGIGERTIAFSEYPKVKKKMPWMSKNYYQSPDGGILVTNKLVAEYTESIWEKILHKTLISLDVNTQRKSFNHEVNAE